MMKHSWSSLCLHSYTWCNQDQLGSVILLSSSDDKDCYTCTAQVYRHRFIGCFPKSIEKKHHYLAHELLQCDCGIEMAQVSLLPGAPMRRGGLSV